MSFSTLKKQKRLNRCRYSSSKKTEMIQVLVDNGCTFSTAYVRLFRDGFKQWELDGIQKTLEEYLAQSGLSSDYLSFGPDFYSHLPSRTDFKKFMQGRGMGLNTSLTRFTSWNFKAWELKGVHNLLPEL